MKKANLSRNHYFILGLLLGLVLSFCIPEDIWELVQSECPQEAADNSLIAKFGEDFEPHLNLINKPLAAKKPAKNVIRPRYYSSELGIREKIFIGVMTSQENIVTLATAINLTAAHLVPRIKFFMHAENIKTNHKLKNIVGFTDNRDSLQPFQVIKYIADNYLDDYDYFLLVPDTTYVDARKLKSLLYHISITFDIYMGKRVEVHVDRDRRRGGGGGGDADADNQSDRNYCDLSAGILLSSSVVKKMRNNLDWCVRNGVTSSHSVNIGRCVKYSSNVQECQETFQGVSIGSFELPASVKLFKELSTLSTDLNFQNASIIHPVTNVDDFYRLHAFFSRHHLDTLKQKSNDLEGNAHHIGNGTISNNILEIQWPLGVPLASTPDTRHDIITWQFMNKTHIYAPNGGSVVEKLNRIDSEDLQKVLEICIKYAHHKYRQWRYIDTHSIYRRFDPTRGMDYHLHLKLEKDGGKIATKSFHIVKPLGRVEIVPSPYVTESTKIAILLPTFEHQLKEGFEFVQQYEKICMKNQDNTFLMLIFMYRYNSSSKGDADPFNEIKTLAMFLSTKYKTDGSKIAWVSIRLPPAFSEESFQREDVMLNSVYGHNSILSVVVADLALPKIGLDSLVLLSSNSMVFKTEFLNRVRMNTIQGFQIFSPIGFMAYPCQFAHFCKECDSCDVSQSTGYFDRHNRDVIAFYSRDYVNARHKLEDILPIMRSDNDIELIANKGDKTISSVLDMFVASQLPIHVFRAVEPSLRQGQGVKNYLQTSRDIPKCPARRDSNVIPSLSVDSSSVHNGCIHLAARKQIGDAIIRFEDRDELSRRESARRN